MMYKITSGRYVISWINGSSYDNIYHWKWGTAAKRYHSGVSYYGDMVRVLKCIREYAINANLPDDAAEWYAQIEPNTLELFESNTHLFNVDIRETLDITNYAKYDSGI